MNKQANDLIINKNSGIGYAITCMILVIGDLRSSVLFLSVLTLKYIAVVTGWSLTRKIVKFVLFLTLARTLTTILFDDLVEIGYIQVKVADYLLDIVSYYVVYTTTLGHWIMYYIFINKKEAQSEHELLGIEIKE